MSEEPDETLEADGGLCLRNVIEPLAVHLRYIGAGYVKKLTNLCWQLAHYVS